MPAADERYMRRVLDLASKGRGRTRPNPMVGAVLVKAGRVVGEGWHRRAGGPHAEIVALRRAGARARGSTLYTNLEPCIHLDKRTPPCVPRLIQSRVRRVVISHRDPNPKVNGAGIAGLRSAGIEIREGVLKREALRLNEAYRKYMTTGLPFVISKAAIGMDGKIASEKGSATWITGAAARREAHRLRNEADAVLVGVNTVLTDDPRLTARTPRGRDPQRVILDSTLRISPTARVLTQKSSAKTILAVTHRARPEKIKMLEAGGAEVMVVEEEKGRVSLADLLKKLGRRGIMTVLLEGGGEVNAAAFRAGVVDKLVWFVAPRLIGSAEGVAVLSNTAGRTADGPIEIRDLTVRMVGRDLMIEGYL